MKVGSLSPVGVIVVTTRIVEAYKGHSSVHHVAGIVGSSQRISCKHLQTFGEGLPRLFLSARQVVHEGVAGNGREGAIGPLIVELRVPGGSLDNQIGDSKATRLRLPV